MSLKLSRVSIPAGATALYSGEHSALYLVLGSATVTVANDKRPLQKGEGTYLSPGTESTIQAGADARAEFLHYQLVHSNDSSKTRVNTPASVIDLHEMKLPAAGLKPGPYEFSMTRVTIPAGGAQPRPHTRSAAALYYVLAEGEPLPCGHRQLPTPLSERHVPKLVRLVPFRKSHTGSFTVGYQSQIRRLFCCKEIS